MSADRPLDRIRANAVQAEHRQIHGDERAELAESSRLLSAAFNRALAGAGIDLPAPQAVRYRYFLHGGVRFCWNTAPATGEKDGRWFAWEYRPLSKREASVLKQAHRVRCGSRAKAKTKAYSWYLAAKGGTDR